MNPKAIIQEKFTNILVFQREKSTNMYLGFSMTTLGPITSNMGFTPSTTNETRGSAQEFCPYKFT